MTDLTTTDRNPVIEFQMRVFRFRDETESPHMKQEQDIVCEIYLEESESTYDEKQCDCYTSEECDQLPGPASTLSTATQSTTQSATQSTAQSTTHSTTQSSTQAPITTSGTSMIPDSTQTLTLTGSIQTAYDFSDDLNDPESDLFKEYAVRVESEMGWIMSRSPIMKSVEVKVIGFKPVQVTRKRRQAIGNKKAVAEFAALAEVPENVEIEDVQTAVETEIQSASDEVFESLDTSSLSEISLIVATTQSSTSTNTSPTNTQTSTEASTTSTSTTASTTTNTTASTTAETTPVSSQVTIMTSEDTTYTTYTTEPTTTANTPVTASQISPVAWDGKLESVELVTISIEKVESSNYEYIMQYGKIIENQNYIKQEPFTMFCTGTKMNGFIVTPKECCTALRQESQSRDGKDS